MLRFRFHLQNWTCFSAVIYQRWISSLQAQCTVLSFNCCVVFYPLSDYPGFQGWYWWLMVMRSFAYSYDVTKMRQNGLLYASCQESNDNTCLMKIARLLIVTKTNGRYPLKLVICAKITGFSRVKSNLRTNLAKSFIPELVMMWSWKLKYGAIIIA